MAVVVPNDLPTELFHKYDEKSEVNYDRLGNNMTASPEMLVRSNDSGRRSVHKKVVPKVMSRFDFL